MAISSYGYEGTLNEVDYALNNALAGGVMYAVIGDGDYAASIGGPGDRAVTIAPGTAVGAGQRNVNPAPIVMNHGAIATGSRWDLIVLRRDWDANQATLVIIPGNAQAVLPARQTGVGVVDDQPLWLVRVAAVQNGSAIAELIDLRTWVADGGATARHELALSHMTRVGTKIRIAGVLWARDLNGTGNAVWVRESGPATFRLAGAPVTGITIPGGSTQGPMIVKTGMLHTGTTPRPEFGAEYANAIGFDTPFPNELLHISITEIQQGASVAHGRPAVDQASVSQFRVMYPSPPGQTPVATERAFMWMAIGF